MELLNILESSLTGMLSLILRFTVPGPPRDPKKCYKWYKFENQNECILGFTGQKGTDDAPKYQV